MSTQPPPKGGVTLTENQYHRILDALDKGDCESAKKILEKAAKGEYD